MGSLVFFGAGASSPFGIPTMQKMVDEFEDDLEKKNSELSAFYIEIKNILTGRDPSIKIDIEAMLSVINGIAENIKLDQMDHFIFYYVTKIFDNSQTAQFPVNNIELAKKLRVELHNYIKGVCKQELSSMDEIYKRSYLPFFKYIEGEKKSFDGDKLAYDWKSYTTNYDNVFEGFWNSFEPPIDHFEQIGGPNYSSFKSKHLGSVHTFCKLHGSLDWARKINTGNITRKNSQGFGRYAIEGEVMLFPIQQKDLYLHPWFLLFTDLKSGLLVKNNWYVVGYAFNDNFIKNVFEESLTNNIDKKLTIIDPDALKIKKKFHESIQSKIDALPIKFGDVDFKLQFKDYTNNSKTLVLTLDFPQFYNPMTSDDFTIRSNYHIVSSQIITVNNSSEHNIEIHSKTINNITKQISLSMIHTGDFELKLKLELVIKCGYNDDLELDVLDNDDELNVSIDYGSHQIFNSKNENLNSFMSEGAVWLGSIKIGSMDFYSQKPS